MQADPEKSRRSRSLTRCERCNGARHLCICDRAPALDLPTRVSILIHWREVPKTTNTAKLAALALRNCDLRVRGERGRPLRTDDLLSGERQPLLLFPSHGAEELGAGLLSRFDRPVHLIVPDGNWNQARKVALREHALRSVPRVKLPPGPPSRYALRHSPHPENLSTFEAIARAIGILHGAEAQALLDGFFELMIERALWSRGRLTAAECRVPIPEAAIRAFYEDGCRGSTRPRR